MIWLLHLEVVRLSNDKGQSLFHKYYLKEILIVSCFFLFIYQFTFIETLLGRIWTDYQPSVIWEPLHKMAYDYVSVVIVASIISFILAFVAAVLAHVYKWQEFKELMNSVTDIGTTFPTIALIAILVPVMGYGFKPIIIALIIYGLLPVWTNTSKGLEEVDKQVVQAARGMGMSPWQILIRVELPLAIPLILSGIKTTVIINIAATSIGAVVGAGGLGMPIVSGIRTNEPILIIKGAVPIALLATFTDRIFYRLERKFKW